MAIPVVVGFQLNELTLDDLSCPKKQLLFTIVNCCFVPARYCVYMLQYINTNTFDWDKEVFIWQDYQYRSLRDEYTSTKSIAIIQFPLYFNQSINLLSFKQSYDCIMIYKRK